MKNSGPPTTGALCIFCEIEIDGIGLNVQIREIEEAGYPTRVVTREGFEGDWPFRADRVVVERRGKIFYIVNIEGFAFSLNGAARSRFDVPDPHDAGVAVLGKSVSPFMDMASALT